MAVDLEKIRAAIGDTDMAKIETAFGERTEHVLELIANPPKPAAKKSADADK